MFPLYGGGCEKFYPVLRGGGGKKVSDPQFSYFKAVKSLGRCAGSNPLHPAIKICTLGAGCPLDF